MEVTYTLTADDLDGLRRFHARYRTKRAWYASAGVVVVTVFWALELLYLAEVIRGAGWGAALHGETPTLLSFLLLSLYVLFLVWGQRRLMTYFAAQGDVLRLPTRLRIGPDGIETRTQYEQTTRAWGEITDVGAGDTAIYLYLAATIALVVPRRAFPSPDAAQHFEADAHRWQAEAALYASAGSAEPEENVWPPRPKPSTPPVDFTAVHWAGDDAPGALSASFALTRADFVRSLRFLLPRRPALWIGSLITQFLTFGALFALVFPAVFAFLGAAVAAVLLTLLAVHNWVRRTAASHDKMHPQGTPSRIAASSAGLRTAGRTSATTSSWQRVTSVQQRRGDVFVMTRDATSIAMVPRTAFATPQAAAQFADTLRGLWQQGRSAPAAVSAPAASLSPTE